MRVNLTDKGLKVLGLKPNRKIVNVPTDRAYLFMDEGLALKDRIFMSLYNQNNPSDEKLKPGINPKKEKATSKKASGRSTAAKK